MTSIKSNSYSGWCVVGIMLQLIDLLFVERTVFHINIYDMVGLIGGLMLMRGLYLMAKAKNRDPLLFLLAFLSIIGLIIVLILKDKSVQEDRSI